MNNLTAQISGLAMLALAALPIAALATGAHAHSVVRVADINLLTADGMATFHQRADSVARDFCSDERSLSARANCRIGVKAELNEKVAVIRAAQLARTNSTLAAR